MSTADRLRDPVTVSRAVPVLRELQTSKEGRCHTRRRAAKTRPAHEGPGQRQAGGQHAEQRVGPTLHREVGGGDGLSRRMTCSVRCRRQPCLATWRPRLTLARAALTLSLSPGGSGDPSRCAYTVHTAQASSGHRRAAPRAELQVPEGGGVVVTPVPSGVAWGGDLHMWQEPRQLPAPVPLGQPDPEKDAHCAP